MPHEFAPSHQHARTSRQVFPPSSDAEGQEDSLLARLYVEQSEQASILAAPPLDSRYLENLAALVEEKHNQADRIEEQLEIYIEREASKLQHTRSSEPGVIALPRTKLKWQQQLLQQQSTMQRLQARLERVREIKNGMGLKTPRIADLATRKLRYLEPGLASQWDELQAALRRSFAIQRMNEQEMRAQPSCSPTDSSLPSNTPSIRTRS